MRLARRVYPAYCSLMSNAIFTVMVDGNVETMTSSEVVDWALENLGPVEAGEIVALPCGAARSEDNEGCNEASWSVTRVS